MYFVMSVFPEMAAVGSYTLVIRGTSDKLTKHVIEDCTSTLKTSLEAVLQSHFV